LALDFDRLEPAYALASRLQGAVDLVKVGSQLFTAEGPRAVKELAALGFGIFLDLKLHDIPNTVAGAVSSATKLGGVRLMTLHASGGLDMMRAAREAAGKGKNRPRLLGVTVLTSLNSAALKRVGFAGQLAASAIHLARLSKEAGLDGVVASAHEGKALRRACGPNFLILIPGVRPAAFSTNDQARVATPQDAVRAGANYLVVGRPITAEKDPVTAALRIRDEMIAAADPKG
jgi:orotidine-5'-phosphate decarboxylase